METERTFKLTDPEVIEHLKGNYYIRREDWNKDTGIYLDGESLIFICGPLRYSGSFCLPDLEARWILCPKE